MGQLVDTVWRTAELLGNVDVITLVNRKLIGVLAFSVPPLDECEDIHVTMRLK